MAFNDAKITVYNDSTPAKGATFEAEYQRIYDNFAAIQSGGAGAPTLKSNGGVENGAGLVKQVVIDSTVQNNAGGVNYAHGISNAYTSSRIQKITVMVKVSNEAQLMPLKAFSSGGQRIFGANDTNVRVIWSVTDYASFANSDPVKITIDYV